MFSIAPCNANCMESIDSSQEQIAYHVDDSGGALDVFAHVSHVRVLLFRQRC